ncbi:MAG: DUF3224 domain-containing protein [Candidatus Methylomirabilales bacterium]
MRRVILGLVLSFLMLGAVLVPAGMAQATRPTQVDSTLTLGPTVVTDVRFADGNIFITQTTTATFAGDLVGTFVYEIRITVHPTGKGNYHLSGSFDGTVDGQSGTAVIRATGEFESQWQSGKWVMQLGTDDLAGLHIQGSFEGPLGGPISLSGWMHFDP